MIMQEFLLLSTELRDPYEPRSCRVERRIRSELRDDMALVSIGIPLPRHIYGTEEDLDWVILATRHQGYTLFPISEWPSYVYICQLKGNQKPVTDTIASDDLVILDWGEIRQATKG
jgi:hypothetical protein